MGDSMVRFMEQLAPQLVNIAKAAEQEIADRDARVAYLEGEVARLNEHARESLRGSLETEARCRLWRDEKIAALEGRVRVLTEALGKYGAHDDRCAFSSSLTTSDDDGWPQQPSPEACNCGLWSALAPATPAADATNAQENRNE